MIALRYHSDIASLNAPGKPCPDEDISFNTPISRLLEGTWEKNNGNGYMNYCLKPQKTNFITRHNRDFSQTINIYKFLQYSIN